VYLYFEGTSDNRIHKFPPNFTNPSNDVSTPSTFGVISALTVNLRIMQYALKLEF